VRHPVGRSRQTRKDRGVHHTPAQLVFISHVRPRVHAGPRLLHIQRIAQAIGSVLGTSGTRLQAHTQPSGFRYARVYYCYNINMIIPGDNKDAVDTIKSLVVL